MTDQIAPNKKKIIDWNKKSVSDSERIGKHLEQRAELEERATTENDSVSSRRIATPASGVGLQKLRQKIREVYDEDDDEDENGNIFFNIRLLNDNENETNEEQRRNQQKNDIFKITREQQQTGKLDVIMSSAMAAHAAGLSPAPDAGDSRAVNSTEYDVKKLRRDTLKKKINKPLRLKGELPEKELTQAISGIKNARYALPSELLQDMTAAATPELAEETDEETLAKLILEKSGRAAPSKKLSEIAAERQKKRQNSATSDYEKEND